MDGGDGHDLAGLRPRGVAGRAGRHVHDRRLRGDFGWLVFLLARGFFARSLRQIALAVVLFAIWGGVLLGVLPGSPQVSWQGHLFGALAGLLCALLVARADRGRCPAALTP